MITCPVNTGILTILAILLTSITLIFAQPILKDTIKVAIPKKVEQKFDFEKVAKQLTGLSKPTIDTSLNDSLSHKLKYVILQDFKNTHGNILFGFAYGLNTVFIDTSRSFGSVFKTSGDFTSGFIGVPLNISFNYSTLKVPLGTNNFFRISLDKERLLDKQKQKLTTSIDKIEEQQTILKKKQAELTGLLGYVEVYLDQVSRFEEQEKNKRTDELKHNIDEQTKKHEIDLTDSIEEGKNRYQNKTKQNKIDINLKDSLRSNHYQDSVVKIYKRLGEIKNCLDSISNKLEASKELLNIYKTQINSPNIKSEGFGKTDFLKSIRTLDLGLSYPKTTSLSDQNVPIKGIHLELQLKKYYFSVASGLTLNNLMLSTNEIQNKLNYNQNVFNNFDFQQILNNGWLTTLKTGYGTPESTHAFVGFNYLTNTRLLNPSGAQTTSHYDPAASFELDFRYVPSFYKGGVIDLIYGKTSLNKHTDTVTEMGVFQSVFSKFQSHFLLAKYTQNVSRLRTDFSISYRRIDPFANTTQFGMMQPNNQRIEFKSNHRVAKFMRLGMVYKLEENIRPLLGASDLRLNVAGITLSGNYTSLLSYSFFVNHIHHQMRMSQLTEVKQGNNYLIGLSLVSMYDLGKGKLKSNSAISYNDYLITDTSSLNKYTQFGIIQSVSDKKYQASLSYDYFFKSIDGLRTGTSVFGVTGKYKFKKLMLAGGLKLSSDFLNSTSTGGHLEVQWAIYKFLDLTVRGERFVLGDFYRNYYRTHYEKFPYLITIQTRFKI